MPGQQHRRYQSANSFLQEELFHKQHIGSIYRILSYLPPVRDSSVL